MHGESKLLPTLTSLPTMKRMVAINADQGLFLVSLSLMMRTTITIISVETEIHLPKAWGMML